MHRRAKTTPKIFLSDREVIKSKVLKTMEKIASIVGGTLGPNSRLVLLESELPGVQNRISKDGASIYANLGSIDPIEHLIIETTRDCAQKVAEGAGDGTTTTTLLAYHITKNIFDFCENNPTYSPQKAVRKVKKILNEILIPYIRERSILINENNQTLLKQVARISANGDEEMSNKVCEAFDLIGYGDSSHITIRETTGPEGYKTERIDGLPIPSGMDDLGRFSNTFINDQANLRCFLTKPLFLLFDGMINDLIQVDEIFAKVAQKYADGDGDFKNLVLVAHGFSENVMTTLSFNFFNPGTINILPLRTPMAQFVNSQQQFLLDLSAFTGAKVFGLKDQLSNARVEDLGFGMEHFECYRYRSTVVGDPESMNIEVRADQLRGMIQAAESKAERIWLEERIAKLTCGIARITIFAGSGADLKEKHDRVEDATMAVRSTIKHGCLPGGGRIAIDLALKLARELPENDPVIEILMPALLKLPEILLSSHSTEEIEEIVAELIKNPELVYDIENERFGTSEELGLFDASKAVEEALTNAISVAGVLGVLGGIVVSPRDDEFERSEAKADAEFGRATSMPEAYQNEANLRP